MATWMLYYMLTIKNGVPYMDMMHKTVAQSKQDCVNLASVEWYKYYQSDISTRSLHTFCVKTKKHDKESWVVTCDQANNCQIF